MAMNALLPWHFTLEMLGDSILDPLCYAEKTSSDSFPRVYSQEAAEM